MSKWKNIIIQAFVCIPITLLLSFCWIRAVYEIFNQKDILLIILLVVAVIILSYFLCVIRGQGALVSQHRGDYKYRNMHFMKSTYLLVEPERFVNLQLGEQDNQEGGKVEVYFVSFTWWIIFTILFAPILVFTQTIGLIFAFIASPKNNIYSSYTKLEYNEYQLPFLQRILHFFFNFVLW